MKKIICLVLLAVMMVTILTACGKFTCDTCGQEKSGKKHESEVLGVKVVICDDCYKATQNALGELSGLLG